MAKKRKGNSLDTTGGVDVDAQVQAALRESYLENTKDLQHYADKVKHFNQQKKAIRGYLVALREFKARVISAARKRGIDLCGGDKSDLANLAKVFKDHAHDYDVGDLEYELCIPNRVPHGAVVSVELLDNEIGRLEERLNTVGDDSQLANIDLQNAMQKQQQTLQMMSNISKMLHDTAMAIIRKMSG